MKLEDLIKKSHLFDAMYYDLCLSCDDETFIIDIVDVDDKNQKINVTLRREKQKNKQQANQSKKSNKKINEKFVKLVDEEFGVGSPTNKIIVKIPYSGISDKILYFLKHDNQVLQMNEDTYNAIVESFKIYAKKFDLSIPEQNKILYRAFKNISMICYDFDCMYLPKQISNIISNIGKRGGLIDSWFVKAGLDPLFDENGKPLLHKTKWFGYQLSEDELNMLGRQLLYEIYNQLKSINFVKININDKSQKLVLSIIGKNGIIPHIFQKLNMKYE